MDLGQSGATTAAETALTHPRQALSATESEPARQARLAAYRRHCVAIVESSDDIIISKTLNGIIESWNPAAERLLGYAAEEMIGQPMTVIFPQDRLDEEASILERIRAGERVEHFETVRLRKDGRPINLSVTIAPIVADDGQVIGASKIARDITERFRNQKLMWLQANFDNLTGMPNRRNFAEKLEEILRDAKLNDRRVAVLFIDLDHFKQVNDVMGRNAGNQALAMAAGRIREAIRKSDAVARFGGDEFGVMLNQAESKGEIDQVTARLMLHLKEPLEVGEERIFLSCSIGISVFPADGDDADDLIRHADLAMYQAKRAGRDRVQYYEHPLKASAQHRLRMADALHRAVELDQFSLAFQPIVDLRTGRVRKCEALIRWLHPERGVISPVQFIPIAEEIGLMHAIGDWVFRHAVRQLKIWQQRYGTDFQISLNMSPSQLQGHANSVADWVVELARAGVAGGSVIVEITESMMLHPDHATANKLRTLRMSGMQLAIDDFGTGYSCLANLNKLDASFLKIDQSFTRSIHAGSKDLALCRAIVSMARALGLDVVAEGVETAEQKGLLEQIGCDYAQGYLYSRPLDVPEFEHFMELTGPP
jgi:diguanylate cyclase (GGDEF)-like protein/PAS domain S-box-containing protein